jgi:hypothetical protein
MALEQRFDFAEISIEPKTGKIAALSQTESNGYTNGHTYGHVKEIEVNGHH